MNGIERIAAERQRQIDKEGWTPEHDDAHEVHEMAMAAALYATPEPLYRREDYGDSITLADPWPWDERWDKRPRFEDTDKLKHAEEQGVTERIRCLEKAGALVAAEIDRLLRLQESQQCGGSE